LISGESGTGKELIAQALHDLSLRVDRPFIKVNCASLNENLLESELFGHVKGSFTGADRDRVGRFQAAEGGSIFLDEFGDLPLPIQVKLLRVLEDHIVERVGDHTPIPVNVRIITATNRDLQQLMAQGQFRQDLFYRINVVPIQVPALRERREDIPVMARAFLERAALKTAKPIVGLSPLAMDALYRYHWPGNVRELKNAVEYATVICRQGVVEVEHLPAQVVGAPGDGAVPAPIPGADAPSPAMPAHPAQTSSADDPRKAQLVAALKAAGGNQTQAAQLLGVSRMTVWKRMKRYGIRLNTDIA
jgi:transcriptional regulator with GAF, ATPase, and Fis domain